MGNSTGQFKKWVISQMGCNIYIYDIKNCIELNLQIIIRHAKAYVIFLVSSITFWEMKFNLLNSFYHILAFTVYHHSFIDLRKPMCVSCWYHIVCTICYTAWRVLKLKECFHSQNLMYFRREKEFPLFNKNNKELQIQGLSINKLIAWTDSIDQLSCFIFPINSISRLHLTKLYHVPIPLEIQSLHPIWNMCHPDVGRSPQLLMIIYFTLHKSSSLFAAEKHLRLVQYH